MNRSIRSASVIAGVGLLAMSALAGFAKFAALDALVTAGDAARTARDVMASEGLFRLGIAGWFVVVALDVVVAWALFRVFRPVSTAVSMLAAWCRLVYAAVFMVAIAELVGAIAVLSPGIPIEIASFTFIGEFLLALWLVIRGSRVTLSPPRFHEDPIGAVA